jgi:signal transduction histidine kinase/ligand-binding sensor domain-containing protein
MIEGSSQPVIPRFETLGVNEGLSQSSVYSIYQDKLGFIWFGTADGLNRYDGSRIKVYKNKETLENPGNSNLIRGKLCEDAHHNIWFTTETGLYYFDRSKDQIQRSWVFPKQFSGILYYELVYMDSTGNLWLFNKSVGLVKRDIQSGELKQFTYPFKLSLSNMTTSDAVADRQGNIWFSLHKKEGFYRFKIADKSFDLFFKGEDYRNIFFGKQKNYLVSDKMLYRLNKKLIKEDSIPLGFAQKENDNIHAVFEDSYDRLWVPSASMGLFCYDFSKSKTFRYYHNNAKLTSLPSNYITVLECDQSSNLWIGTDGGGVCKLDLKPSRFNLFPSEESDYPLKDYFIKCLYEDDLQRIWFGTNSNGLGIYEPQTQKLKTFLHNEKSRQSLPGNSVSVIFRDRQKNMWIGTDMGIALFNEERNTFTTIPLEIPSHYIPSRPFVFRITQTRDGDILAATMYGLIRIRKDNTGNFHGTLEFSSRYGNFWMIDIAETPDGGLWMAAPLNGLFHTGFGYGRDSFIVKEKFFSGIDLRSLHRDERDPYLLWIASGKGLIRMNTRTKQFEVFNEENGMANSYVYGILEDEKHNLWMSTNAGLIYFDRNKNSFQNFTVNDGLQSNEFNTGAFHKGASGKFYFGGIKGFNWFKDVNPGLTNKPFVAVTDIAVNDGPFQKDNDFFTKKLIRLAYDQNNLSFRFAALDFTRPAANKIQYRLEGWDPNWVITEAKSVRYSNLSPGTYTLRIKASNSDGIWSDEQSFIVHIEAPFWKRWWFYSLAGLAVLVTAIFVTKGIAQRKLRQQLHELEKQRAIEAERNRISKDMHDEIGSGLTHIALMSELIQTQKKADEELKKDVGSISSSARKLVESMSEIIWALNPQNDTLQNLLAYLREQTIAHFEPFDIQYSVEFPDEVPHIKLSNEQRRNLFLVVKEALNNALKHSGASEIRLTMEYANSSIAFCVGDNGKGLDESKIKIASNGLKNMRKRMEDIGGTFHLQSDRAGCRIRFSLPVDPERRSGTTFFTSLKKQS